MKKTGLLLAVLLCVCGCQKQTEVEKTEDYATMGFPGVSEDGIYHMVQTDFDKEVYFYDFASKKDVPLCSKVNCNHANEDCEAYKLVYYHNDMKLAMAPVYYQEKLYYFYENLVKGKTMLCSSDVDGTNVTKLADLADMAVIDSAMFYDQKLWYTENAFELDEKGKIISTGHTYRFQVLDLTSKESKLIREEEGTMVLPRGAMNHTLYLSSTNKDGESALVSYQEEWKELMNPYDLPNSFVIGTYVYGYDEQRNQVYRMDVTTMQKEDVMEINIPQGYEANGAITDDSGVMTIQLSKDQQIVGEMYVDVIHEKAIEGEGRVVYIKGNKYYRLDQQGMIVEETI